MKLAEELAGVWRADVTEFLNGYKDSHDLERRHVAAIDACAEILGLIIASGITGDEMGKPQKSNAQCEHETEFVLEMVARRTRPITRRCVSTIRAYAEKDRRRRMQ